MNEIVQPDKLKTFSVKRFARGIFGSEIEKAKIRVIQNPGYMATLTGEEVFLLADRLFRKRRRYSDSELSERLNIEPGSIAKIGERAVRKIFRSYINEAVLRHRLEQMPPLIVSGYIYGDKLN